VTESEGIARIKRDRCQYLVGTVSSTLQQQMLRSIKKRAEVSKVLSQTKE